MRIAGFTAENSLLTDLSSQSNLSNIDFSNNDGVPKIYPQRVVSSYWKRRGGNTWRCFGIEDDALQMSSEVCYHA